MCALRPARATQGEWPPGFKHRAPAAANGPAAGVHYPGKRVPSLWSLPHPRERGVAHASARDRLRRALVWLDVWTNAFEQLPLAAPRPDCPCCGQRQFVFLDAPTASYALTLCGRNTVQVVVPDRPRVALAELAARLAAVGRVRCDDDLLRLQVEGYEITVFPDARALIKGTTDPALARALYSRYIGA